MTVRRPRGYALLVVLVAIAVATAVVVQGLLLRAPKAPQASPVAAWHLAHTSLFACLDAASLLDTELDPAPPERPAPFPMRMRHRHGACTISRVTGPAADVFTVDVHETEPVALRALVVRPHGGAPYLVYAE